MLLAVAALYQLHAKRLRIEPTVDQPCHGEQPHPGSAHGPSPPRFRPLRLISTRQYSGFRSGYKSVGAKLRAGVHIARRIMSAAFPASRIVGALVFLLTAFGMKPSWDMLRLLLRDIFHTLHAFEMLILRPERGVVGAGYGQDQAVRHGQF